MAKLERIETLDYDNIHTALCIWECHIEARMRADNGEKVESGLELYHESNGSIETRDYVAHCLAPAFDKAWENAPEQKECWPFDFELVPPMVEEMRIDADGAILTDLDKLMTDIVNRLDDKHKSRFEK